MTQCALAAVLIFEYPRQPSCDWVVFCSYTSYTSWIVYRDPTCICLYCMWTYVVGELSSALGTVEQKNHTYIHTKATVV